MTDAADLLTVLLARDIVRATRERSLRIFAITSTVSTVAALLAQRTGAPRLAVAGGFGRLDVSPRPAVTCGEFALGMQDSPRSTSAETFMALARGRVGVVVTPAQVDARAALNLSGIGGDAGRPAVALPGSRGLPDNNHSSSTVWYVVPELSTRRLVPVVDFASGAAPAAGVPRLLLSPTASLAFDAASGWRIAGLTEGTSVDEVRDQVGFELAASSPAVHEGPTSQESDVLDEVDPHGLRRLDVNALPGDVLAGVLADEARSLAEQTAHR